MFQTNFKITRAQLHRTRREATELGIYDWIPTRNCVYTFEEEISSNRDVEYLEDIEDIATIASLVQTMPL